MYIEKIVEMIGGREGGASRDDDIIFGRRKR